MSFKGNIAVALGTASLALRAGSLRDFFRGFIQGGLCVSV